MCSAHVIYEHIIVHIFRCEEKYMEKCFRRSVKDGEKTDHSVSPIYHHHIVDCISSYSLEGTVDATRKKFTLLCVRQSCGRALEIAWVLLESLTWDSCFKQVCAHIMYTRVSMMRTRVFIRYTQRCMMYTHVCAYIKT